MEVPMVKVSSRVLRKVTSLWPRQKPVDGTRMMMPWPLTRAQRTHTHSEGQNQGKDNKGVLESALLFYQQHGPQPS